MEEFDVIWQFLEAGMILASLFHWRFSFGCTKKGKEVIKMLVSDANKKRQSRAWMISRIMEIKESLAKERLAQIEREQPSLKVVYEDYLKLYNLHIKPLMPAVKKYFGNMNEKKKIEHFLQGQDAYRDAHPPIIKLPYAGKSQVGHAAANKRKENAAASDVMAKLKQLDPNLFAQLLKQVGGK